jgi:hypothetical protein
MPQEPALLTSAGRMPKRSQHRVSEGQRAPIRLGGLVDVANVRRRGVGTPDLRDGQLPSVIGYNHWQERSVLNVRFRNLWESRQCSCQVRG